MCAGQSVQPLRACSCRTLRSQHPCLSEAEPRLHTTCCSTDRFIVSNLLKRSRSPIALLRCSSSDCYVLPTQPGERSWAFCAALVQCASYLIESASPISV